MKFRSLLPAAALSLGLVASIASASPETVARGFVTDLLAGKLNTTTQPLTPEMKKAVDSGALAPSLAQLKDARIVGEPSSHRMGPYTIVDVPITSGGKPLNAAVTVNASEQIGGLFFRARIEEPANAAQDWVEEKVTVGSAPWTLPGFLTLPKTGDRLPAIVILGGSGPTDADGTVAANKPYRDLAHSLAPKGVAVLRYDKRPYAHGKEMMAAPSVTLREEYVDDAVAAIALLKQNPRVDPARIFLFGHSLGAHALPRVAEADPSVAGLIFSAPGPPDLAAVLVRQLEYIAKLDGTISPEEQAGIDEATRAVAELAALTPDTAAGKSVLGVPAAYWLDLREHDPRVATARLPQPLLFLQGGRDYQVTPADAKLWKDTLDAAGKAATWKFYPDVNHLMIAGTGVPQPGEYATPGRVDVHLIDDVAAFVLGAAGK